MLVGVCVALLWSVVPVASGQAAQLSTPWEVDPRSPLPEYPRPTMVRDEWVSLNGPWDYAITAKDAPRPGDWDGKILVPYAVESRLSQVGRSVGPEQALWYRRPLIAAGVPTGGRLLLHFGAVDHAATVWVGDRLVGEHVGGFDPFTLDITDAITAPGTLELVVRVSDPTDAGAQPRGKQTQRPHGIWYTAVSGIWQTVWLEAVPATRIERVVFETDGEAGTVRVVPTFVGQTEGMRIEARVRLGAAGIASGASEPSRAMTLHVGPAQWWTPDAPTIYQVDIALRRGQEIVDRVQSYFAFRTVQVKPDEHGIDRIHLNGKPLFMLGLLDQGWWPDGLYTAPSDEALKYDLELTKRLGFNMLRKHVKVEPERFYYWADVLGVLIWQDMPSGDRAIGPSDPDIERTPESEAEFRRAWQAIIDARAHHPSIVAWIPFNEGWGQFKTNEILEWTKSLDPSRLVGGPSGWSDRGVGDLLDMHMYPGPGMFPPVAGRASVLGEFGGLGLPVAGHLWQDRDNWGYRTLKTADELESGYAALIEDLRPLIARGLAAAVYTQTTDVEGEVNGLITYDRRVIKIEPERLRAINARAFLPPPSIITHLPTSEQTQQPWRWTSRDPGEGWQAIDFREHAWAEDIGGFGTPQTPGTRIGTVWNSSDIWLRRTFTIAPDAEVPNLYVRMHHDEAAKVYLNGKELLSVEGYTTGYRDFGPVDASLLRRGMNVIAVQCTQTMGGQYIDVGLVSIVEQHTAP